MTGSKKKQDSYAFKNKNQETIRVKIKLSSSTKLTAMSVTQILQVCSGLLRRLLPMHILPTELQISLNLTYEGEYRRREEVSHASKQISHSISPSQIEYWIII